MQFKRSPPLEYIENNWEYIYIYMWGGPLGYISSVPREPTHVQFTCWLVYKHVRNSSLDVGVSQCCVCPNAVYSGIKLHYEKVRCILCSSSVGGMGGRRAQMLYNWWVLPQVSFCYLARLGAGFCHVHPVTWNNTASLRCTYGSGMGGRHQYPLQCSNRNYLMDLPASVILLSGPAWRGFLPCASYCLKQNGRLNCVKGRETQSCAIFTAYLHCARGWNSWNPKPFLFGASQNMACPTARASLNQEDPMLIMHVQPCHMNVAHFLKHRCFIGSRDVFISGYNLWSTFVFDSLQKMNDWLQCDCDQYYLRLMNAVNLFLPRDYPRFFWASEDMGPTTRIKETHANNVQAAGLAHICTTDTIHSGLGVFKVKHMTL